MADRDAELVGKEEQLQLDKKQLEEALRFSLGTFIGICDTIKAVEQERTANRKENPANMLDPEYRRPWWPVLIGLGGACLGYLLFMKNRETTEN